MITRIAKKYKEPMIEAVERMEHFNGGYHPDSGFRYLFGFERIQSNVRDLVEEGYLEIVDAVGPFEWYFVYLTEPGYEFALELKKFEEL